MTAGRARRPSLHGSRRFAMFRIVTIEREFGSGGGGIACELARRLGWKLWDQQLTCEIAKRAQVTEAAVALCDERVDSRLYKLKKKTSRPRERNERPTPSSPPPSSAFV